eukprot:1141212-Pelagomonas_calceolata.AAC.2
MIIGLALPVLISRKMENSREDQSLSAKNLHALLGSQAGSQKTLTFLTNFPPAAVIYGDKNWTQNSNKVLFDVNPKQTLQRLEAVNFGDSHSTPSIPPLKLPEVYSLQVACIYGTGDKCKGMLTPERINYILYNAFDRAKQSGMHGTIQPPPKSFAPELLGLSLCSILSSSKHQIQNQRLLRAHPT